MYKKTCYSEIIFKNEYYIDGVNIFDDKNRVFLKNIDINLKSGVNFDKVENADLYEIIGLNRKFKVAIKRIRDFYVIAFLSMFHFLRACRDEIATVSSHKKNSEILEEVARENIEFDLSGNYIYSKDKSRRAKIISENNLFKVKYQDLCVEDEILFYFRNDISSKNFFSWEDRDGTVSFFNTMEEALKEIDIFLNNSSEQI